MIVSRKTNTFFFLGVRRFCKSSQNQFTKDGSNQLSSLINGYLSTRDSKTDLF